MSKFCGNCGAQLDDSAKVCGFCGAPLENAGSPAQKIPGLDNLNNMSPEKKANVKKYGIIGGIAAAAIIVLIIVISIIAGATGPDAAAEKLSKAALVDFNAKKVIEYLPEYAFEDEDKDDAEEEFQEILDEAKEELEDEFDDYKVTIETKKSKEITKKSDKNDIFDSIELFYDDFEEDDVKKVYEVKIKITLEADDEKESDTVTLTMGKVNGDWVILNPMGIESLYSTLSSLIYEVS